jgi:hypothetical protein
MPLACQKQNPLTDQIRLLLRQIIQQHDGLFRSLPRSLIASCMMSHDIHLLGAINSILDMPRHVGRIDPPLDLRTRLTFKMRYCERCLIDNPNSEWADGRYTAGWEFAGWFLQHYRKGDFQPSDVNEVRQWVTQLFHKSTGDIRICLIRTVLAEIIQTPAIAILFSDWEKLPLLREALRAAREAGSLSKQGKNTRSSGRAL